MKNAGDWKLASPVGDSHRVTITPKTSVVSGWPTNYSPAEFVVTRVLFVPEQEELQTTVTSICLAVRRACRVAYDDKLQPRLPCAPAAPPRPTVPSPPQDVPKPPANGCNNASHRRDHRDLRRPLIQPLARLPIL